MIVEAKRYLREQDAASAIEWLQQQPDVLAVAKTYNDLVGQCYWQDKDLAAVIIFARAGIQYGLSASGLSAAQPINEEEVKFKLRSEAKAIAYNLASYTWLGWDEPGLAIGPVESALGLDAAKTNLRLAHELDKGHLALSRAYWIVGAHQLAAGDYEAARANFDTAAHQAAIAKTAAEELLAQGFSLLAQMLADPGNTTLPHELDTLKTRLHEVKDGPDFVGQIETARRVFT